MKIAIIGGGIGGLTTALCLERYGYTSTIFEKSPAIKKVGAGINLAINAMQIFQQLGIAEKIYQKAWKNHSIILKDEQLRTLSVVSMKSYEKQYQVGSCAIHRADLQDILGSSLRNSALQLAKTFTAYETKEKGGMVYFEDGSSEYFDVLIAADGIHSKVRNQLFGNTSIRNANQRCWRAIVRSNNMEQYQHSLCEIWSKGKRFGFVKINKDEWYWYALADIDTSPDKTQLKQLFSDYHPSISQLIAQSSIEDIIENDMIDLAPIKQWYKGPICLMGDAAHATTPNMGQGACQAIESAAVLAEAIATEETTEKAFQHYQSYRIAKAHYVVNTSWKIGKMSHWKHPIATAFRNFLLKNTPAKVQEKQNDRLFQL